MDIISIILIAVGLAMDSFAVAITRGIHKNAFDKLYALKMSVVFGIFQGGMFFLGCVVFTRFTNIPSLKSLIENFDHWIAFLLLIGIGIKMILDDFQKKECSLEKDVLSVSLSNHEKNEWILLFSLGLATSIDAFITGLIFVEYQGLICAATIIIGAVSLLFAAAGMFIGVKFGCRFRLKVGTIGGAILILIGLKVLLEHLLAHI
ncbi:MAG: manganese efflux pump [Prevotellaceae bacterium]|jgi:putative Mn2+ efflux pump MntP|nr:manganese efflux pump [Prevotellaceae bacterium]